MSFIDGFDTVLHHTDMDMLQYMDGMTIRPAEAMQIDHLTGRLEVGLQANMTLFHYNQVTDNKPTIEETIVYGESVYKNYFK